VVRNVEVMLCIKPHCRLEAAALPREVLGVDTALSRSESPRKSPTRRLCAKKYSVALQHLASSDVGETRYHAHQREPLLARPFERLIVEPGALV
jgi:hypothetical protein